MVYLIIIPIIICIIVFLILKSDKGPSHSSGKPYGSGENVRYSYKVNALYEMLRHAHKEHIVFKDDFIINDEYYKSILPGKYVTDYVQRLAFGFFSYLELVPIDVTVVYDYERKSENSKSDGKAGYYRSENAGYFSNRDIHVVVEHDYSCKEVAAILCHEITHYFMDTNGIHFDNARENEESTDIMAVLLGFGHILSDGYAVRQTESKSGNRTVTKTSRIGYISDDDCFNVYAAVEALKQKERLLSAQREKIKAQIDIANQLYDRLAEFSRKDTDIAPTAEDFETIRELYGKSESGYFESQLCSLRKKLSAMKSLKEAEEVLAKANALCTEIAMYSSVIGKY